MVVHCRSMAAFWLSLLCLTSTWMVANGYFGFWGLFGRSVGYYHEACGPTLYKLQAQGVRGLPNVVYIPPPKSPIRQAPPASTARPTNTTSAAAPVQPPAAVPTRPRPPPTQPPTPPRGRFGLGPHMDPWIMLALDIDPPDVAEATTAAPLRRRQPTGSRSPQRIQRRKRRQTATKQTNGGATAPYGPECYCESAWDCHGGGSDKGRRYDPHCDSSYNLVCCCK